MSACERCWADAAMASLSGGDHVDRYRQLVTERDDLRQRIERAAQHLRDLDDPHVNADDAIHLALEALTTEPEGGEA